VLLLVAVVQGLVTATLLWRRGARTGRWAERFLALLLVVLCGDLMPHLVGWAGAYDRWPGLSFFPFQSSFAAGPLVWLAVRALTEAGFRPTRRDLRHAVPFALEKAYYLWAWSHDVAWKNDYVPRIHDPVVVPVEDVLSTIVFAAYLVAAWRVYDRYRRWVDASQSDAALQLEWLRRLLLGTAAALVLSAALGVADFLRPMGYDVWFWQKLLLAGGTYWLAMTALVLSPPPVPADAPSPAAPAPEPEPAAPVPEGDVEELRARVARCMDEERPWLDPALTLSALARRLGMPPAQLSSVVNRGFGRNFNDFVNGYRVRAVQARLAAGDGARLTLLAIALDCGFAAKSTFNRAFRKETGRAPSDFSASDAAAAGPERPGIALGRPGS
ncbi:MAG TPA: helix-turn-helix domain-containing protein, partial [Gemmatimonadales bacterium]|nr:helix-turn-helix domain-containing protein [Gemmatimonadales bacterium]